MVCLSAIYGVFTVVIAFLCCPCRYRQFVWSDYFWDQMSLLTAAPGVHCRTAAGNFFKMGCQEKATERVSRQIASYTSLRDIVMFRTLHL